MKIANIYSSEIFDSRGLPTIECKMTLENGISVLASVPSGKSVGACEAYQLRDGGSRLFGKGVKKAIEKIDYIIAPHFIGKDVNAIEMDLKMIELDGTLDKSNLGANSMLAVSMALYRAQAVAESLELYEFISFIADYSTVRLPVPLFNVINGAKHADNNLTIQEFLIIPIGISNFRVALESGVVFFQELKSFLKSLNMPTEVADEGGFAVGFRCNEEALDILFQVILKVNKKYNLNYVIGLDVAASSYFDRDKNLYFFNDNFLDSDSMIKYYQSLIDKYPIYSIEDGLDQQDWLGWAKMKSALADKVQIVGDDLFATNIFRIANGIETESATSVLIKPNQIGTITESIEAIKLTQKYGLGVIISHRSGETCDNFISDLSVGTSADQIKAGSCSRGERLSKYNRLLSIEDRLLFGFK